MLIVPSSVVVISQKKQYNVREIKRNEKESEMKEDMIKRKVENSKPLFTGDYRRDSAISEIEKVAEASNWLFNAIKRIFKQSKK